MLYAWFMHVVIAVILGKGLDVGVGSDFIH
jgi:hypothetical protein